MAKPKVAAPPAAKPKFCVSKIREVAEVKVCNYKLKTSQFGDICPNREQHLHPMLTGFCQAGWHEGLKINAPTCKYYVNCPCDCHAQLNRMYQMTGDERVLVNNSTWRPANPYVLPSLEPLEAVPSNGTPTVAAPVVESPAPGIVPPSAPRIFAPTVSGRLGKGELESWVKEVTDVWAVEKDRLCTVGYISNEIGRVKGINPPSQGAIQNVLFRWKDLGFAHIETARPMRFTGYTDDGIKFGLENMKARAKRQAIK